MMPKCSASVQRVSNAMLLMMLLLSTMVLQVSGTGVEMTGRRGFGDGDGEDGGDESGSNDPNREQALDMGGLQDSLKTGGANGLADMLAAMGSIKHDTQLIPTTKDADGNEMYNFGALGMTTPAPVVEVTKPATPPPASDFGAALTKTVAGPSSASAVSKTPQAQAAAKAVSETNPEQSTAEQVAPFQGLRGTNTPTEARTEADKHPAAPELVSATVPAVKAVPHQAGQTSQTDAHGQQIESLRQGLTSIREHIDSLMTESDSMLFGKQVDMHTQAVEASSAAPLASESQVQQQQWAEMLRRVSALEAEHTQLQTQVRLQSDHIQVLETDENKDKQQLNATMTENGVLKTEEHDIKQEVATMLQQSKQLQADDKNAEEQLGSVERENKQLRDGIQANLAVKHNEGSKLTVGRQGKHQKASRRKPRAHHKLKHTKSSLASEK